MDNLISIITPTFNRGSLINNTIESVLFQSYKNWELIIIDDGSTDNTEKVIAPYLEDERIRYVHRPKNLPAGGNAARNYGLEICKGEFVKWLDSDDLITHDCLEKQLNEIRNSHSDVTFCRSRFFEQENNENEIRLAKFWHPTFSDNQNSNILENFIMGKVRFSNNDGLWRKAFFKGKPYYEELRNSQEFQMISCSLARGATVSLQNEVLVLIREHNRRMKFKRSYADFAKNQCLARVVIIKEMKQNNVNKSSIYSYLIKSMSYYILKQTRKRIFSHLRTNIILLKKAVYLSFIQ